MIPFDLARSNLKILSVEQVLCGPSTPCLDIFSTFSACTMQDVVHPSQSDTDLCVFLIQRIHGCKEYSLSVAQILSSSPDGVEIERTSDVINILEEIFCLAVQDQ